MNLWAPKIPGNTTEQVCCSPVLLAAYTMLWTTAPAVRNLRSPRRAAAKFRSSLPCVSWDFHRLIFFLQCSQGCSEGSLVSLVSYYPPAGRRAPVCTRNTRQAVLSKTVNAKSLHQSIKARSFPARQWLWETTWSRQLLLLWLHRLHAGQGEELKGNKILPSHGRTMVLWDTLCKAWHLPCPWSHKPFGTPAHSQPHPLLQVCLQHHFL